MKNQEVSRQLQRLQSLINKTTTASGGNIEMQAHWARYLCVLSAGFLENALKEIYTEFVRNTAPAPIANYASSVLSRIQNPKTSKFIETAHAFKPKWGDDLEAFVDLDGRKEAIDSIMSNRHLIAHGKDSGIGITIARLKEYLRKSVEVLEYIEKQCKA